MTQQEPEERGRVLLAYTGVFIVWGSTYLAIRIGVADIPPALLAGTRFLVAGLLLLLFGKLRGSAFPSRKGVMTLSIIGLFLLVGGNGLVVWSEQWIPSGLAALIVATVPLFMSSIDSFMPGGHRLPPFGWFGIVLGLAGVFVLVSPSLGFTQGEQFAPAGIAGIIAASALWSIGSVYARHHPVKGNVFVNTGIEMLAGGIVLGLIAVASGELPRAHFTVSGSLAILYLILFGSIIGFTSYAYLLRHVPAAKASTYAYVNPVVAVILGAVVLAEPLDLRTIVGTIVILGGVAIVQTSALRAR